MTGVDVPILQLTTLFTSNLWTTKTNEFNGRCFRNQRDGNTIPEVLNTALTTKIEYKEVLQNDKFAAVCFFDVLNTRVIGKSKGTVQVNIHFAVNLETLYSSVDERQTEYAYQDVLDLIKTSSFEATGLVTGIESYSPFLFNVNDDMQPYHLFRIETELNYNIKNC
jgi:hypothetical protein